MRRPWVLQPWPFLGGLFVHVFVGLCAVVCIALPIVTRTWHGPALLMGALAGVGLLGLSIGGLAMHALPGLSHERQLKRLRVVRLVYAASLLCLCGALVTYLLVK